MLEQFDFKKIFKGNLPDLSSIFSSGGPVSNSVGIDIGSSSIKVVQIKKSKGKANLETYGVLSLGPYVEQEMGTVTNLPADTLVKALQDVMKESNVTSKNVSISIPSSASLIFNINLPGNIEENNLSEVIKMEARKHIPVPISEVSLDWFIIPEDFYSLNEPNNPEISNVDKDFKKEVFVVAIHNDILIKYKDILSKLNIPNSSMELEVFGNIRSSLPHVNEPILCVDFGASNTRVYIVESGVVRFFHVINRGSSEITRNISQALGISIKEAEEKKKNIGLNPSSDQKIFDIIKSSIDYLSTEANSIVLSFEKKYNVNVNRVVLVGGGSMLSGLDNYLKDKLKKDVIKGDPFSKTEYPAFLDSILKESGPEFGVSIGLALKQLS